MAIVYTFDKDGAFVAGNTETRITVYAYPTSIHAQAAKRHPKTVAVAMLADETRHGSFYEMEYDARNWERLALVCDS